jgi:hypothetical protein
LKAAAVSLFLSIQLANDSSAVERVSQFIQYRGHCTAWCTPAAQKSTSTLPFFI